LEASLKGLLLGVLALTAYAQNVETRADEIRRQREAFHRSPVGKDTDPVKKD
jgi:hypothetical protein